MATGNVFHRKRCARCLSHRVTGDLTCSAPVQVTVRNRRSLCFAKKHSLSCLSILVQRLESFLFGSLCRRGGGGGGGGHDSAFYSAFLRTGPKLWGEVRVQRGGGGSAFNFPPDVTAVATVSCFFWSSVATDSAVDFNFMLSLKICFLSKLT